MTTRRAFVWSLFGAAAATAFARAAGAQQQTQDDDLASAKAAKAPKAQRAVKPLRILLLGGTGFLGPHLVENARARGHTVTLFNRGKTHPELVPDVEKLRGDRNGQLDALRGRSWDAAIDTSGYVPRIVKLSAELLSKQVEQYVFISSISVYPDDVKPGADENTPVQQLTQPGSEAVRKHYGAVRRCARPGRLDRADGRARRGRRVQRHRPRAPARHGR